MLTVKKHLWMKFFMLTLSTTLLIGTAKAESLPVKLLRAEVAVQLKEDENMTGEIHHLRLSCFEGECEINTTIFNRCIDLSGEKSQRIFSFVEKSTDPNSTFKIDGNMIDVSILSRDFGGKTITTYQFELGKKK